MRRLTITLEVIKDLPTGRRFDASLFETLARSIPFLGLTTPSACARGNLNGVEALGDGDLTPRVLFR